MIRRKLGKLMAKKLPAWTLLGAMLWAVTIVGCASGAGPEDGRDSGDPTATQGAVEQGGGDTRGEHDGRDRGGEHGIGGERSGESREAEMSSPIIPLGQS